MTWTTPKTWADQELVTTDLLNTHLRDNLEALKAPPSDHYECDEASDYTTTSTSFVDVDVTNLALTIETNGGDVMVGFHGNFIASARVYFDVDVDGVLVGGDDGIVRNNGNGAAGIASFVRLVAGLAAGEHTFKLKWRVAGTSPTATLYAGAGTAMWDLHPQFWVREVS